MCGPIEVQSYKGDKYITLFVDDYSRMMTIKFLKKKSDTFQILSGSWQELKKKQVKVWNVWDQTEEENSHQKNLKCSVMIEESKDWLLHPGPIYKIELPK